MIPQSQISKLANRLYSEKGGRRITENVLERDYCIAWFLIGLSRTPLRNKLIFKGGTALRRCYFTEYRFSEDLDFSLLEPSLSFEDLKNDLEKVYEEIKNASNITFRFARSDSSPHQNSYTFYLSYEGPLPASSPKEIKVDVTIKEKIVFSPEKKTVLKSFPEFTDLPENETILAYSLKEIAAEKTVALLDRARTEPRDLYDLWYLTDSISLTECANAIQAKLSFRAKKLEDVRGEFNHKENRLEKTWETRLSPQMVELPEFGTIYRSVKRALRQAKITV